MTDDLRMKSVFVVLNMNMDRESPVIVGLCQETLIVF